LAIDVSQRFIFDDTDIRGDIVSLSGCFKEIITDNDYPPGVAALLGEFLVASVLMSSTIKFEGRLVLQARGKGDLSLLMAEVTHDRQIRGIARYKQDVSTPDMQTLFAGGALAVTIEPANGERYQSLVPIAGSKLSDCLEHYFEQSEQLSTSITLASAHDAVSGLLLQQLPSQLVTERANQWQHVTVLTNTLTDEELITLSGTDVLSRLFVEEQVRLLDENNIQFRCTCSTERTARALVLIDSAELDAMFDETAVIEMNCEFCSKQYAFSRQTLTEVLEGERNIN
jgi:molecular chaperone Hsp33